MVEGTTQQTDGSASLWVCGWLGGGAASSREARHVCFLRVSEDVAPEGREQRAAASICRRVSQSVSRIVVGVEREG